MFKVQSSSPCLMQVFRQGLTKVMRHCKCEVLRVQIGSIVRQMLSGEITPGTLWSLDDVNDWWAQRYPVRPQQDDIWMRDFENLMKDMVNHSLLPGR